ncbi:TPA: hypothetical protein I7784_20050 [Vibrio vulnificus]|nr:hypothetical protein [Vibrio vulnificus]ELM0322647.1 hypothetical protein [Vibrio vulnificus]HAS8622585.1 hypothetical protein [Vibrio vulnificus]
MKKIILFVISLGVPQAITMFVGLLAIKHLSNQQYLTFTILTTSCLFSTSIVSGLTNRIIILSKSENDILSAIKSQKYLLCLTVILAYFIFSLNLEQLIFVYICSYIIVKYELERTFYQKELDTKKFLRFSLARTGIYIVLVNAVLYLYEGKDSHILWLASFFASYALVNLFACSGNKAIESCVEDKRAFLKSKKYLLVYFSILPALASIPVSLVSNLSIGEGEIKIWMFVFSIYTAINVINTALKKFLLPYFAQGNTERSIFYYSFRVAIFMIPIVVVTYFLSTRYLAKYVDLGFSDGLDVALVLMLLSSVISTFLSPCSEMIQVKGMYGNLVISVFLLLSILISLSFILIPKIGAVGMAISFIVGYFSQNAYIFRLYIRSI